MKHVELLGLETLPDIQPGYDIADCITTALKEEGLSLEDGDILVVSSKIVSKAEGRIVDLQTVTPSKKAQALADLTGKDARRIQVIIEESEKIVAYLSLKKLAKHREFMKSYFGRTDVEHLIQNNEAVLFTVMPGGQLMTDAGTDFSNVPGEGMLSLLPKDPMSSARKLRKKLKEAWGVSAGVVITDTEIRALRNGTADIAIGYDGITALEHSFGEADLYGKPTFGGIDSICDQIANGSALLTGQRDESIPAVLIRGLAKFQTDNLQEHVSNACVPYSLMGKLVKEVAASRVNMRIRNLP